MKARVLIITFLVVLINNTVAQNSDYDILYTACVDNKCGFVDQNGNWVIKPQYDDVYKFASNGLAAVKSGDKWGYVDKSGKIVIPLQFIRAYSFAENGLALVERVLEDDEYDKRPSPMCYIDKTGKIVISLKNARDAGSFDENGLACFCSSIKEEKYGYINSKGKVVVKPQFGWTKPFDKDGFACVELNDEWGCIDPNG